MLLRLFLVTFCLVASISGQGRLVEPPGRSSAWRYGFDTPVDFDDDRLNCGGYEVQWVLNGGACGVCGDRWDGPREHEVGGQFASGTIVRSYGPGETIPVQVELTTNRKGWMEFRLCVNNNVSIHASQDCFDGNLLADYKGKTRQVVSKGEKLLRYKIQLPENVTCTHCVLQWMYDTGDQWNCDPVTEECGVGFGPQEQFYGCADIAIGWYAFPRQQAALPDIIPPLSYIATPATVPGILRHGNKRPSGSRTTRAPTTTSRPTSVATTRAYAPITGLSSVKPPSAVATARTSTPSAVYTMKPTPAAAVITTPGSTTALTPKPTRLPKPLNQPPTGSTPAKLRPAHPTSPPTTTTRPTKPGKPSRTTTWAPSSATRPPKPVGPIKPGNPPPTFTNLRPAKTKPYRPPKPTAVPGSTWNSINVPQAGSTRRDPARPDRPAKTKPFRPSRFTTTPEPASTSRAWNIPVIPDTGSTREDAGSPGRPAKTRPFRPSRLSTAATTTGQPDKFQPTTSAPPVMPIPSSTRPPKTRPFFRPNRLPN